MINQEEVKEYQNKLSNLALQIKMRRDMCFVGSDETRMKILILINDNDKLCVTDLANILNVSVSAVSHQLNLMTRYGFLLRKKEGKKVCYCTIKNNLVDDLTKDLKI